MSECVRSWDGNYYDDTDGLACNADYSIGNIDGGTVYGGGITNPGPKNFHVLDVTLASILSGIALFKKEPYVPTSNNPYNQPAPTIIAGGGGIGSGGHNISSSDSSITAGTLGKAEAWVKKNPGASAIIGLIVAAAFLKPMTGPQRSR